MTVAPNPTVNAIHEKRFTGALWSEFEKHARRLAFNHLFDGRLVWPEPPFATTIARAASVRALVAACIA